MDNKIENYQYWIDRDIKDKRVDWNHPSKSWIEGYWKSVNHPHRSQIVKELKKIEFDSLLEVGCNAGANIARIRNEFEIDDLNLAGCDVNKDSILFAQSKLPDVLWRVGNAKELVFVDKEYDVVLADAVLMYADPDEFNDIISEMDRVAKKAIIICDWFNEIEEIKDEHWCRDYKSLLEEMGFDAYKVKITKWPTKSGNWERNGWIFVGIRK